VSNVKAKAYFERQNEYGEYRRGMSSILIPENKFFSLWIQMEQMARFYSRKQIPIPYYMV